MYLEVYIYVSEIILEVLNTSTHLKMWECVCFLNHRCHTLHGVQPTEAGLGSSHRVLFIHQDSQLWVCSTAWHHASCKLMGHLCNWTPCTQSPIC